MRKLLLLLVTEGKQRNAGTGLVCLGMIVLITMLISTFSHTSGEKQEQEPYLRLGVANQDDTEYSSLLLQYFRDSKEFLTYVKMEEGEERTLLAKVERGELDCLLVIPENFVLHLIAMEQEPVRAVIRLDQPTKAVLLQVVLDSYETYIQAVEANCAALYERMREEGFSAELRNKSNVNISLELVFTALGKDAFFAGRTVEAEKTPELSAVYGSAFLFLTGLFLCVPLGLRLGKQQTCGVAKRLWCMNISPAAQLGAALLPYLLLELLLMCGILLGMSGKWQAYRLQTGVGGTLLLFTEVLLFAALGLLARRRQTYLLLACLFLVVSSLAGGAFLPMEYLPDMVRQIGQWLPNARFVDLMTKPVSVGELSALTVSCVAVLAAQTAVLLLLMKCRREEKPLEVE